MARDEKHSKSHRQTNKELFEDIILGNTMSPISLIDFRRYLQHQEHSIENLDFYKWYLTYCKKFNSLPLQEREKSPPPRKHKLSMYHTKPHYKEDTNLFSKLRKQSSLSSEDLLREEEDLTLELSKPQVAVLSRTSTDSIEYELKDIESKISSSSRSAQQPFRREVDVAIKKYFTLDSEAEVNVSSNIRNQLLRDVTNTTNPAVFEDATTEILSMLINSSIPNFRASAVQNITPKTIVWRIIRTTILLMICCVILFCLVITRQEKWCRATLFPILGLVVTSYITNPKGICLLKQFTGEREVLDFEDTCDAGELERSLFHRIIGRTRNVRDKGTDPRIRKERLKLAILLVCLTVLSCGILFTAILLIPN
ncbi:hypothetical protein K7432_013542 [Basidiobolus ranarum]|uniref:RGS domain-containing protein n=1 Tax=Basidiobolus ranarum TaxID=34480 RepID=A0ABR2VQM0_9FUNG